MTQLAKLGLQIEGALAAHLSAEVVAYILTTTHPKRLDDLFRQASARLLKSHQEARSKPHSLLALERRNSSKILLDLIRARSAAIGSDRPTVSKMLAKLDPEPGRNVIDLRRAA